MNIGLIGAENSHAEHFCQVINRDEKYPGFTITHVYGGDNPPICAKLCAEYSLTECATEDEVISLCDALVVTYRKGSLHYGPVMKALKAGKAVFNDKPFATDVSQAQNIADCAKLNDALLYGGSSVKDLSGLSGVNEKITADSTVVISFSANPESEYDGFWFYGIHSVELCIKLLGQNYKTVSAFRTGNNVISSVNYGNRRAVIVNTPDASGLNVSIQSGDESETINVPMNYQSVCPDEFIKMLMTGKAPYDYTFYVESVRLMGMIIESAGL